MTSKFEYSRGPLGEVLRTSWGSPKSTSQGRPLNVILRRPLDVILGRLQYVRLGRPQDVRSGLPGRWNRIFRGRPGNIAEGHPQDVLGTNICRLGIGLSFLLLNISSMIPSKTFNILRFYMSCILQCFHKYPPYSLSIQ